MPVPIDRNRFSKRTRLGQMATVFNTFLACFVLLVLGVFAFELDRFLLARQQLTTNAEIAGLTCETALASSSDPSLTANQSAAANTALKLFSRNTIVGAPLSHAQL